MHTSLNVQVAQRMLKAILLRYKLNTIQRVRAEWKVLIARLRVHFIGYLSTTARKQKFVNTIDFSILKIHLQTNVSSENCEIQIVLKYITTVMLKTMQQHC